MQCMRGCRVSRDVQKKPMIYQHRVTTESRNLLKAMSLDYSKGITHMENIICDLGPSWMQMLLPRSDSSEDSS